MRPYVLCLLLAASSVLHAASERINPYGIMTMLNSATIDTDAASRHLQQARELVGEWGWVRQFFHLTEEEADKAVEFLLLCRAKHLVPIVCLVDFEVDREPDENGTFRRQAAEVAGWLGLIYDQGHSIPYIEVGNEPNLHWGGPWPDPMEYARLLVEVSRAIKSVDPNIKVMNAALAPSDGTDEADDGVVGSLGDRNINNLTFIDLMFSCVPEVGEAIDIWASHPYSGGHPPEWRGDRYSVAGYEWELAEIARFGYSYPVVITEAGYSLDQEGMTEDLRAEYMVRAFRDVWAADPRVLAACPFELGDLVWGGWEGFNWVRLDGTKTPQYEAVAALAKPEGSDPWGTPSGPCSISGRVGVRPAEPELPAPAGGIIVWAQPGDYAAETDRDGRFLLRDLPAGTYTLRLRKDGYAPGPPPAVEVDGHAWVRLEAKYYGLLPGGDFDDPARNAFTVEPEGAGALLPAPLGRRSTGGLLLVCADGAAAAWRHTDYCSVTPGRRYEASAWVLAVGKRHPAAGLSIEFCDNVGVPVENGLFELEPIAPPLGRWTRLSLCATAPERARRAKVTVRAEGRGTLVVDDVACVMR